MNGIKVLVIYDLLEWDDRVEEEDIMGKYGPDT